MMQVTLNDMLEMERQGLVSAHRSTDGLIGFKYKEETVYGMKWNPVVLQARGITFVEATGEIVARPFAKFFNYQELMNEDGTHTELYNILPVSYRPNLSGPFRILDKIDGSLGIVFHNPVSGKWQVKTSGDFYSPQADWANAWMDEHVDTRCFNFGRTYCFEIVYNEDIHPVHYDYEEMVLLGAFYNDDGSELPYDIITDLLTKIQPFRLPEMYHFDKFQDIIPWATKRSRDKEGVVVTFENGFRTKLKSEEWLRYAELFESCNYWGLWKRFDVMKKFYHANVDPAKDYMPLDDEVLHIPEELKHVVDFSHALIERFELVEERLKEQAAGLPDGMERKDLVALTKEKYPNHWNLVLTAKDCYIDKRKPLALIRCMIKKKLEPTNEGVLLFEA